MSDLCFAGDVESFPFQKISGALYVHFLAKVMPKFSVNFSMTCARKLDNQVLEICRDGSETTFRQNKAHFFVIIQFII